MTSRFKFTNVGAMSYEVRVRETDKLIGNVWRNRDGGWFIRPVGKARQEVFSSSREVAASVLNTLA